ncbi:hypothetical protein HXX76_002849 [Chlamydomonas incerta]|uniref:BTB domain-containing protein n=1 Tax=Chlamydomonas incerta TaxID=51695 RepID=A0A835W9A2_CHLIN|nr:hypothetical protein HXX76_002849 [Chlamydomonas incerta]|eukprot:KAG2442769.1 hypothetical protein HXX76_002849 [Chlamydomonas incerta]
MLSIEPLELRMSAGARACQRYFDLSVGPGGDDPARPDKVVEALVWDDWSSSVYFALGHAIMRLVGCEVTLVAGDVEEEGLADGAGPVARLAITAWQSLASDGAGSLFVASGKQLRRIRLPESWQALEDGLGAAGGGGSSEAATGNSAAVEAVVSTLPFAAPADVEALTFAPPGPARGPDTDATCSGSGNSGAADSGGGCGGGSDGGWLVFTTRTALYRLPLPLPATVTAPPVPGLFDLSIVPQPLAGAEGQRGTRDGRGGAARFDHTDAVKADGAGNLYTVETWSRRVRRVLPDGAVTTLLPDISEQFYQLAILPNGHAALVSDRELRLVNLGLQPLLPRPSAAGAAARQPPPRSLRADLGALLDAQPDGTSDLAICVGERRFHVHRAILSARCDYFRQRLAGDAFEDARAAELELPDADPEAFALLLRWLYTGDAQVPDDRARAVAELADRLLLPDLCAAAQTAVAASVSADTVVDCLLWAWRYCESRGNGDADACGGDGGSSRHSGGGGGSSSCTGGRAGGGDGGFGRLLGRLKRWYVCHHERVAAQAGDSRTRLAAAAPHLMVELVDAVLARGGRGGLQRPGSPE